MHFVGLSSEHIMLTNSPHSPTRRIKLATQIRASTTPAPRSIPTPTMPPGSHQEQWGHAYSPASSTLDRSPSVADVSPVVGTMRWSQQPPQVSTPVHEPERSMHPVDHGMQQQISYNYSIDPDGRPVQPVQPAQFHSEPQMLPAYTQSTSPADYHPRHSNQPMPTAQTPTYAQYQAPQAYMPHSPHDPDHHLQMMHRQSMDSQQQLLYNMPQNMKAEQ
jgi:hypothetical protein